MREKRKTLLCFLAVFFICLAAYSATLSNNFMAFSDYLDLALRVEGRAPYVVDYEFGHLGWMPAGKFVYGAWKLCGYQGGAILPLEILNIFAASLAAGFIFLGIKRLTEKFILSAVIALVFGFSLSSWIVAVNVRLYPVGTLFLAVSFYFLLGFLKRDRFALIISSIFCGLSCWFHLTNFYLFFAGAAGIFLKKEPFYQRFKNFLLYLGGFAFVFLVPFLYFLVKVGSGGTFTVSGEFDAAYLFKTMAEILSSKIGFQADWASYFHYLVESSARIVFFPVNKYLLLAIFLIFFIALPKIIKTALIPAACAFVWLLTIFLGSKNAGPLNPNSYNMWFPVWVLFSMVFVPGGEERKSFLSSFARIGGTILAALFLTAVFITNFYFYLLPQHSPRSDVLMQNVLILNKNLAETDNVVTMGMPALYFKYYGNCKVVDMEYIYLKYRAKAAKGYPFDQLFQEIKGRMEKGERVYIIEETSTDLRFQSYSLSLPGVTTLEALQRPWTFDDVINFLKDNFQLRERANTPFGLKLMELAAR